MVAMPWSSAGLGDVDQRHLCRCCAKTWAMPLPIVPAPITAPSSCRPLLLRYPADARR